MAQFYAAKMIGCANDHNLGICLHYCINDSIRPLFAAKDWDERKRKENLDSLNFSNYFKLPFQWQTAKNCLKSR
jgi:hypothetical protein